MTKLNSGVFDGNWREALESTIRTSSGRRRASGFTAETFEKYRKSDDYAIIFSIPESAVNAALVHPQVLIGSDGIWDAAKKQGHPRCAGTYARILGRYVREQKLLAADGGAAEDVARAPPSASSTWPRCSRRRAASRWGADADWPCSIR